ncbi:hypothetical protein HYH03_002990, partial [Edaphochlamys debaryana]
NPSPPYPPSPPPPSPPPYPPSPPPSPPPPPPYPPSPPAPPSPPFDASVSCRIRDGTVLTDTEVFPFGTYRTSTCTCDTAPYKVVFGANVEYRNVTYHTFRLLPKECDNSIVVRGRPVCSISRAVVNKIAFRLTTESALCFSPGGTMTTLDKASNYRGVKFWTNGEPAPDDVSARVGYTFSKRSVEIYIYGLKGPQTDGTFLMKACADSFATTCKRSAEGMCLWAFVDTPGHQFVSVCRAEGLLAGQPGNPAGW